MSLVEGDSVASVHSGHNRRHRSSRSASYRIDKRSLRACQSSGDEALLDKDEVVKVEIVSQTEDTWGENTTCVTGNTSERSYSCDDIRIAGFRRLESEPKMRLKCARYVWLVLASLICLLAVLTPVLMVSVPKTLGPLMLPPPVWNTTECTPDCEGRLLSFGFRLLFLVLGIWALFFRRAVANLPRLFLARASLLALVFLLVFAYWLFYIVRIVQVREKDYSSIVTFAYSLVDALLWVHYLALVFLEIRHQQTLYRLRVVRSPDGESRTYNIGQLSIQRAAVYVLQSYYRDFPVFNPFLMKPPGGNSRMRIKGGSQANAPPGSFKYYTVDGESEADGSEQVNAQAVMFAAARKRDSGHNERFYEELDWERRVRKRKARLVIAAEEAFAHIKRLQEEKGPCAPMDAKAAAEGVFPAVARCLQKYLRVTRQQPRHTAEQVVRHLAQFLTFNMSARSFLERFFSNQPTFETVETETNWSIVCERQVSLELSDGVVFQLRCHCPGPDAGVQLFCVVSRLPFFNLTEEVIDIKNQKFVFRMNSETSV